MLILGVGVLFVAALMRGIAKEWDEFVPFFGTIVLGIFLLGLSFAAVGNRVGVEGELVQIHQVRVAATTADPAAFRDIYNEVLSVNELIVQNRWYRTQWWAKDFVSARWDTVTTIPIH